MPGSKRVCAKKKQAVAQYQRHAPSGSGKALAPVSIGDLQSGPPGQGQGERARALRAFKPMMGDVTQCKNSLGLAFKRTDI
jgi:hypothetical protein